MFRNELWFEATVTGNLDGQGTKIPLERLGIGAVATLVGYGFMLVVTQMDSKLHNGLGELLKSHSRQAMVKQQFIQMIFWF